MQLMFTSVGRRLNAAVIAVALLVSPVIASARGELLYNPPAISVAHRDGQPLTLVEMRRAVIAGGLAHEWSVQSETPDNIRLVQIKHGEELAVVDVHFNEHQFQIVYVSSTRFDYEAGSNTINGRYNSWVRNLIKSISDAAISL